MKVFQAPQDTQDFQDEQDREGFSRTSKEIDSTFKEKHRALRKQCNSQIEFGPLEQYLRRAYDSNPTGQDRGDTSPLFYFARLAKGHPEIIDLPEYEAVDVVDEILTSWLPTGEDCDPWEYFFPETIGDASRLDFMTSWKGIRHIPFLDVLSNAVRLADEQPIKPPHRRTALYQRFVSLAAWLQVLMKHSPILLPTRNVGEVLECDQRTVSKMRKFAEQDGLLVLVKNHLYRGSKGKGEASEFRFQIDRYPQLRGTR